MSAPRGSNLVTCCASVFVCDWTLSGPLRALWPPWVRRALSPVLALRVATLCLHPNATHAVGATLIHRGGHLGHFRARGLSWLPGSGQAPHGVEQGCPGATEPRTASRFKQVAGQFPNTTAAGRT